MNLYHDKFIPTKEGLVSLDEADRVHSRIQHEDSRMDVPLLMLAASVRSAKDAGYSDELFNMDRFMQLPDFMSSAGKSNSIHALIYPFSHKPDGNDKPIRAADDHTSICEACAAVFLYARNTISHGWAQAQSSSVYSNSAIFTFNDPSLSLGDNIRMNACKTSKGEPLGWETDDQKLPEAYIKSFMENDYDEGDIVNMMMPLTQRMILGGKKECTCDTCGRESTCFTSLHTLTDKSIGEIIQTGLAPERIVNGKPPSCDLRSGWNHPYPIRKFYPFIATKNALSKEGVEFLTSVSMADSRKAAIYPAPWGVLAYIHEKNPSSDSPVQPIVGRGDKSTCDVFSAVIGSHNGGKIIDRFERLRFSITGSPSVESLEDIESISREIVSAIPKLLKPSFKKCFIKSALGDSPLIPPSVLTEQSVSLFHKLNDIWLSFVKATLSGNEVSLSAYAEKSRVAISDAGAESARIMKDMITPAQMVNHPLFLGNLNKAKASFINAASKKINEIGGTQP